MFVCSQNFRNIQNNFVQGGTINPNQPQNQNQQMQQRQTRPSNIVPIQQAPQAQVRKD